MIYLIISTILFILSFIFHVYISYNKPKYVYKTGSLIVLTLVNFEISIILYLCTL